MLFVHPGLPKTATTSIQQGLANCPGILCASRPNHVSDAYNAFWQAISVEKEWSPNAARCFIDESVWRADGRSVVIFDETLSSPPLLSTTVNRLAEIAPGTNVILTIRNQPEILMSRYRGGGFKLKGVPNRLQGRVIGFGDWFDSILRDRIVWRQLNFALQSRIFARHFPVTLLIYEDMIANVGLFENHFGSAIGGVDFRLPRERFNPSETARSVTYQRLRSFLPAGALLGHNRLANAIRTAVASHLSSGALLATRFNDRQRAIIGERCRASNREIAATLGRDLGSIGYTV